jgi:hypothetical protein
MWITFWEGQSGNGVIHRVTNIFLTHLGITFLLAGNVFLALEASGNCVSDVSEKCS